LFALIRPSNI